MKREDGNRENFAGKCSAGEGREKAPFCLSHGDKVALVCCSNGLSPREKPVIESVKERLASLGLEVLESPFLYRGDTVYSGSGGERAGALMEFFENPDVRAIFDVSGGDMANELLTELDFQAVGRSEAMLFGYSDLTVILDAVYARTGKKCGLYQIKNLAGPFGEAQLSRFRRAFLPEAKEWGEISGEKGKDDSSLGSLLSYPWDFLRGSRMEGVVVGGNVRCLLKLAGTPFWPSMERKILFMESNGGEVPQMVTYLSQLKQMGVWEQLSGVLLGTFTQMEQKGCRPSMEELVLAAVPDGLPVAKTPAVGHGSNSACLVVGERKTFRI